MKVDGLAPGQGNPADRVGAKRPQAAPGKSFSEALKKASQGAPGTPAPSNPAPKAEANAAYPTSHDDHLAAVKQRMQTGYYDSKKVEDAITDKLSGYFDEIA